MRPKLTVIALIVLAVVLAGCGGGGTGANSAGSTSGNSTTAANTTGGEEAGNTETGQGSSSTPLSKKAFLEKAEAVCEKVPIVYKEKLNQLGRELKKHTTLTTADEHLKAAVPPIYAAVEELRALEPPKGDEQKIEALITALEAAAKGIEAKPKAPLAGSGSPYTEFQKLAKAYGLTYCSRL